MASAYFKLKLLKRKRKQEVEIKALSTTTPDTLVITNDTKKCRICLQEGTIPIYGNAEYSEYIRQFGDIEISNYDKFPKYLCTTCNNQLQNAILFRKKAKESDSILRQNMNLVSNGNIFHDTHTNEDSMSDDGTTENDKLNAKSYQYTTCKLSLEDCTENEFQKNTNKQKHFRIQCPICFSLLTSQLYKKHLARHKSATHLVCEVCGKLYRKDNLIRHLQLHSHELPHQCQLCPYRGRFVESLKIHMRTHTGNKPFSCDKCQLRFLTRSNLNTFAAENAHTCFVVRSARAASHNRCVFHRSKRSQPHGGLVHTIWRRSECVNRHSLTHRNDKPLKCTECSRGFYLKRDLDAHFKADHAGIKDYGCRICCNKYGTRKALMRHELRVHKRDKLAKGRMPLYLQAEYKI